MNGMKANGLRKVSSPFLQGQKAAAAVTSTAARRKATVEKEKALLKVGL
jgi:hypothetical protein